MRQYVTSLLRRLWWFAAIPTILHISLVSSLVIRQSETNQTIPPEVVAAGVQLQNCASAVMIPVLQFVVTNFVAHAFTVRFSPGYGAFYTIIFSLKALVFPCFGLLTACRSMENLTLLEEDPLNRALEAGALCTVARTEEWKPEKGDVLWVPQDTSTNGDKPQTPSSRNFEDMTPIYCKEEGLEGLQQRYIKVHGLCRLPRAHANAHDLSPEKDRKCCDCKRNLHAESPEGAPISNPLRHCQKGQYMLVRIPPHCKVRWRGREGFHDNLRRFHSKERRSFIEFFKKCFSRDKTPSQSGSPTGTGGGIIPAESSGDVSPQQPNTNPTTDKKPHISNYDLGIAGNQSVIKSFVALVQLFSIIQILRARKFDDYGAYQLTLIPYALMSLVNVTSGILTPSYPAVYMIDSTVMEEARRRGGIFDGVIGQLDEDAEVVMTKMIAGGSEPSTDLRATEGSESSINPKEVGESEKSTHSKVEARSEQPANPSTGGRRHFKRREREKPLISFGGFHAANNPAFLAGGYFHHLARSFPLLRLIKDPFMRRLIADKISGSSTDHKAEKEMKSSQRIFQRIYNKPPGPKSNSNGYYAVLEIGNVQHEISVRSAMPLIMDIVMIIALALPYVTIYALTGFNAPTGSERVHGIVFMLWLTVGQVLPFFLVPSWNLINLEIWRVKLNWRMFWGFLCTSVFTMAAFAGFYFVGEMRYQELILNNSNCTTARDGLARLQLNGSTAAG